MAGDVGGVAEGHPSLRAGTPQRQDRGRVPQHFGYLHATQVGWRQHGSLGL